MKKILLVLTMFASFANAGAYVGTNVTAIDFSGVELNAVQLVIGNQLNEFVGIELRAGTGLGDDNVNGVTVELDSIYGGYLTLTAPISDSLAVYAIAGNTWAEATASTYDGYSASAKDDNESFGMGVRFNARESMTIKAEWMNYGDDVDGVSVGIQANF